MPRLHAAGLAYLQGAHDGAGPPTLRKLLADFRAELLAERTDWQVQELSRQEKDEGQTAAWHMRRVALAAQAWLRQSEVPSESGRTMKERLARLDEFHQALVEFAGHSSQDMARISGAAAFTKAAQDLVALTQGAAGKRPAGAAALAACRRLMATFNALVVD
jgi:beta-phosphoglucomutase-like phosphatase (HAD superfamily)